MKLYPYIGKSEQGNNYLVASGNAIYSFISNSWMTDYNDGFAPMENITREYLQNTYGEVQSPEHAEFIVELAELHGFELTPNGTSNKKFFHIGVKSFAMLINEPTFKGDCKQITIPLPHKADKQEVSEWPVLGSKVIMSDEVGYVRLMPDSKGYYVIEVDGEYSQLTIEEFEKPKTPEEELREKIGAALCSFVDSEKPASEHIDEIINIFKKPQ